MTLSEFRSSYLTVEERDSAVVARFTRSHLSEEDNIEQMGHELVSLIEQYQCRRLVLSLEHLTFITSSALGKLISLHRRLHRKEGRMVMCDIHGPVAEVLRTSRLYDYFTTANNTEEALAAMATP